jgi:hypothetical protein
VREDFSWSYRPRLARGHGGLRTITFSEALTEQELAQGAKPRVVRHPVCNRTKCEFHAESPGREKHFRS